MYVVGTDVGGTFTDCVVLDGEGRVRSDKSPTTPENTAHGMIEALANVARPMGLDVRTVLHSVKALSLGTTSVTNRLVTRTGARVGMITTRGHEDALLIGRVLAKTEGLSEADKTDVLAWSKPTPIVGRGLIKGVTERVDYKGAVIIDLNEEQVEDAVSFFQQQGVEAIAVCLLWSFRNPTHERRIRDVIHRSFPDCYVALSSDVAPVLGEYERANAVVLSAHLGPVAQIEMQGIRAQLNKQGLTKSFFVMSANGGSLLDEEVPGRPLDIVASGPVGGVAAATKLGERLGHQDIIVTDMGGTSFEVGIITGGAPHLSTSAVYNRFRVAKPQVEVVSIGAGGGSIAWIDEVTRTLQVGPASAGAVPGPVCYDQGGEKITVTDADVLLGRIDPQFFFSGRKRLNVEKSRSVLEERLARPLGVDTIHAAEGILKIVDARMGDLIRRLTVERGLNPHDFVLYAYGGAGPTHVGAYAREAGIRTAVVPLHAATFSALGVASADMVRSYSKSDPLRSPFSAARITSNFAELERAAKDDQGRTGFPVESMQNALSVDMRFRHQVHQVRVPVGDAAPRDEDAVGKLATRFVKLYEQTFGSGTAAADAGMEILTFHLESRTRHVEFDPPEEPLSASDPAEAVVGTRSVCFDGRFVETVIYEYEAMRHGNKVAGPAIIEAGNTTVVVYPDQEATLDSLRNIVFSL